MQYQISPYLDRDVVTSHSQCIPRTTDDCSCCLFSNSLASSAAHAELDSLFVQDVLEGKEESGSQHALGNLGADALVETRGALIADNALEGLRHTLLLGTVGSNVHAALDGDVRVRHAGGEELAQSTEEEGNGGGHLAALLDVVLHLLKERVLKNGVDDEHQGGEHAGEEGLGTLVLEERHQRADGGGLGGLALGALLEVVLGVLLAGGDAGVDDPDGVGEDDGRRAGNGARNHGLNGGELLVGAAGGGSGLFEEGARPLVPVVVDKVGDADAEQRRVDARVQARHALAGNDLLDGIPELALFLFGFDLGTCREGDERVATIWSRVSCGRSIPLGDN